MTSVDACELGCWGCSLVSALRVIDPLKSRSSAVSFSCSEFVVLDCDAGQIGAVVTERSVAIVTSKIAMPTRFILPLPAAYR